MPSRPSRSGHPCRRAETVHTTPSSDLHFTRHAQCRSAQRAIPPRIVEQLLAVGKRDFDHRGGVRIHLHDRSAQHRFAALAGSELAAQYRNAYLVVDCIDLQHVITVGWCHVSRRTDPAPHLMLRR